MEKPNFSKIARDLNVSRETVRKYYNGFKKSGTRCRVSKVSKHHELLVSLLNDEYKHFNYISSIYRYLNRDDSIVVDYSQATLRRYISKHLSNDFSTSSSRHSIRFETEHGAQVQFDYKENQTYIDVYGNEIKVDIATLIFGNSRNLFREVIADKTTESTIEFMAKVFERIGGVPKQLVIDNTSSMIAKSKLKLVMLF